VSVLEGPDLAMAESLDSALAGLPEVYVQAPGGRSGFASLFLRGADPNFTSVLLEGVVLNSPTNSRGGAYNLAAVPTAAIGRVELIAGPASTLYGSGALAGALNILLPQPTQLSRVSIGASLGSEGEQSGSARWQGPVVGGWAASLGAVVDNSGTALPGSMMRSRSLDLLFSSLTDRRDKVLVHFANNRSSGYPDSSGGIEYAPGGEVDQRESDELILAGDYALVRRGAARLAVSASYLEREDYTASPGVKPSPFSPAGIPGGSDDIRYRSALVRPTVALDFGTWQATIGAEARWEHARSDGYLDFGMPVPTGFELERTTRSSFADLAGQQGPFQWDAGLRLDFVDNGEMRLSGRAGVRAALSPDLALKVNSGNAWKAPSFYALANPFVGNPDLKTEGGASLEVGLEHLLSDRGKLTLTLFRSRYRNLIDFVPGDVPRLENRAMVQAEGASASLEYRLTDEVGLSLASQYVNTRDRAKQAPLLHRPRWRGNATIDWRPASDLDLRVRYSFTDERHDFAIPVGSRVLEPTHQASASIAWRPTPNTQVLLAADNLFDDRTGDAIGFPALPRRVRISLTKHFE
jgi:outer membrane cobalamin receptor